MELMAGLATFSTFAVDILSTDYLMKYVCGCNDKETACFLQKISNCTTFCLTSKPIWGYKGDDNIKQVIGYDIVTTFDKEKQSHVFGTSANMVGF